MIQQGVGKLWATNGYQIMEVFLEPALLFSGQNKYTNIRRCWTIFYHKTGVSSLLKVPNNCSFEYKNYSAVIKHI